MPQVLEKLSKRVKNIIEPSTIQMAKLSREFRAKGLDVISLSLGEPDFNTPEFIKEAAILAIRENYTHYPPVAGYQDLKEAVTHKLKKENNLEYKPGQIVISTGAKQAIINILLSILEEGEEIIIPSPYWVSYPEMVKLTGAKSVFVQASIENDFKITPAQLEAAITPSTRAFIFSSPCNPTGSVYNEEELKSLAEVFKKHPQVMIISDEIYEYINFVGHHTSFAHIPELFERTAVINGMSKGFAMTGWRIGYMAGPEWLSAACEKMQSQFTSAASSISQRASLAALEGNRLSSQAMCEAFRRRRDELINSLKKVEDIKYNIPEGAFYLFPDISAFFGKTFKGQNIQNADDFSMYLLQEAQVSTVSGVGFGAPGHIRLSFAASDDDIREAARRICEAVEKLV
jgi:aspartate aminotransferase